LNPNSAKKQAGILIPFEVQRMSGIPGGNPLKKQSLISIQDLGNSTVQSIESRGEGNCLKLHDVMAKFWNLYDFSTLTTDA
jgi:hypothetical protein